MQAPSEGTLAHELRRYHVTQTLCALPEVRPEEVRPVRYLSARGIPGIYTCNAEAQATVVHAKRAECNPHKCVTKEYTLLYSRYIYIYIYICIYHMFAARVQSF